MAGLNGKKTGRPTTNWDYYVVNNKEILNTDLEVEDDSDFFSEDLMLLFRVHKGQKLKLITTDLYNIRNRLYAKVFIDSLVGYLLISKIRKPTNSNGNLTQELYTISELNRLISEKRPTQINILNADGTICYTTFSVTACVKISKTPKADFKLLGVPEIFISHKSGSGKLAFQQFSGITPKSSEYIDSHEETKNFIRAIRDSGFVLPCARFVQDPVLIRHVLFGRDYGKEYGENNCHIVAQGIPSLDTIQNSCYSLNWSESFIRNSDIKTYEGEIVFAATKRSCRRIVIDGVTHNNIRVNIFHMGSVYNRTGLVLI